MFSLHSRQSLKYVEWFLGSILMHTFFLLYQTNTPFKCMVQTMECVRNVLFIALLSGTWFWKSNSTSSQDFAQYNTDIFNILKIVCFSDVFFACYDRNYSKNDTDVNACMAL